MEPGGYVLATAHRAGNVDDPQRLARARRRVLRDGLGPARSCCRCTRARARGWRRRGCYDALVAGGRVRVLPPLGYVDVHARCSTRAAAVLTDSGGVQKEAYLAGVRCVTLRDTTEWVETVDAGWNALVDLDADAARAALARAAARPRARSCTATATPARASWRRSARSPADRSGGGSAEAQERDAGPGERRRVEDAAAVEDRPRARDVGGPQRARTPRGRPARSRRPPARRPTAVNPSARSSSASYSGSAATGVAPARRAARRARRTRR